MATGHTPVLRLVPYGPAARAALGEAILDLRAGDPLAPVTVVVPSALAGTTLRRALAGDLGGLAGVDFVSLPGLAERLGGPRLAGAGRRRLDRLSARAMVAAVLAQRPGAFRGTEHHPATAAALADTVAELRALDDAELERVAAMSPRAADVVRVHRAVRRLAAGWYDDHDVLRAAVAAVQAGDPALGEVGAVVLHLPRTPSRDEVALVAALHRATALRVLVGTTGRPGADAAVDDMVGTLVAAGIPRAAPGADGAPGADPGVTTAVVAPDPAEEARHAVRVTLDALRAGTPPERIALVSRVREPYSLLLHEELAAAGVAHSAPSPERLDQTMPGRTLLGLLRWERDGARRDDLMRILRSAPVRGADRMPVRSRRWDREAREAGVVAGLDQWRLRLPLHRAAVEQRAARAAGAAGAATASVQPSLFDKPGGADRPRTAVIDALGAFVEHVVSLVDLDGRTGWAAIAKAVRTVFIAALGGERVAARWDDADAAAHRSVLEVLDRLAGLDGIGDEPDVERFLGALAHELRVSGSGRVGRFGHGVTVARLVDAVGADFDLVVLLGAAEGSFPPRRPDDPLLPARERRVVPALRPRGSTPGEEERDVWAVLAAAPRRLVTTPRADPRNQREQHRSPWFDEIAAATPGGAPESIESFQAWLEGGRPPATPQERDVAELLRAHRWDVPVADLPLVDALGAHRSFTAAAARRHATFDEWNGFVGEHPYLAEELPEHLSATSLEAWATCSFRFFLRSVLEVRAHDDPAAVETIDSRDRGSLVHDVLEAYFGAHLGDPLASQPTPANLAELARVADEVEARYRAEGLTGRRVLWDAEWSALKRHLATVLRFGAEAPQLAGLAPLAVEHAFGRGDDEPPPVEVEVGLPRPLRFGGRVDRIDVSVDRRRAVVLDYKTGRSDDYDPDDPVKRGQKLQLVLYAAAARALVPEAEEVDAYYWYMKRGEPVRLLGYPVDDAATARFHEVLATMLGAVDRGLFPARPGEPMWLPSTGETYSACAWCDYDRVCPKSRADAWEAMSDDPALEAVVALVDPPADGGGA